VEAAAQVAVLVVKVPVVLAALADIIQDLPQLLLVPHTQSQLGKAVLADCFLAELASMVVQAH
jgi:hypothetical protein